MKTYEEGLRDGFEEAANCLESRAAVIKAARMAMKPEEPFYDTEVTTLMAAATMLRSLHSSIGD